MNFLHPRIALSLVVTGVLLATPTAAQAKQFTKLLQLGQLVPGSNQPVTDIVEPTIGLDGQVAVLLKTKSVRTGAGPFTDTTFKGIYSVPRNGQVRLVEGGITTQSFRSGNRLEFSAPSISEGKIAYLAMEQAITPAANNVARSTKLRIGTAGAVKTILSLRLSGGAAAESGKPNLAFVNGKAYFLDDLLPEGADPFTTNFEVGVLGLVNTLSPTPSLVKLRSNPDQQAIRASAKSLLVSTGSGILESAGDGNFKPVEFPPGRSISNSFSVSRDNIVVTDSFNPATLVRFGQQGKFSFLPVPPNSDVRRVFSPAISNRSVIYQAIGPLSSDRIPTTENIYLSKNGQAGISLIAKNDTLDGKTVSRVALADNGRTIAGNSAVFTASFTDGTTALYRVDF